METFVGFRLHFPDPQLISSEDKVNSNAGIRITLISLLGVLVMTNQEVSQAQAPKPPGLEFAFDLLLFGLFFLFLLPYLDLLDGLIHRKVSDLYTLIQTVVITELNYLLQLE